MVLCMIKKWMVFGALCIGLQSCTQVDDYLLGKDNTPKPAELSPIKEKVHLKLDWVASIGSSKKTHALKLKPVVNKGVVYVAGSNGLVQAIDAKSAKALWSNQLKQDIMSGPTVNEGMLAVGTSASTVVLLNQADGRTMNVNGVSGDVFSKPIISNHRLIAKTIDGNVYAFDTDGKELWVSEHGAPHLILQASSSPIVLNNIILVGFSDGKLDAIDPQTGRVLWQRSIVYASGSSDVERLVDIDADPIVQGDTVYIATYQGYVGAMNLSTGQFIWSKPASVYKNMAIGEGDLFFVDNDDVIWAISRQTGQVKWKQTALKARGVTAPSLSGNRLVVGDKTGLLHILSTTNGEFIGREQLGGAIYSDPTISGRQVYVVTANGKLNRLSIR